MTVDESQAILEGAPACGSRGRRRRQTRHRCSRRFAVNRYYDPVTDQFLSVDAAMSVTRQPYEYGDDNPLNVLDPLGLCGPLPPGEQGPTIQCPIGPLTPAEAAQYDEPYSYYLNQAQAYFHGMIGPVSSEEICRYAHQLESQAQADLQQELAGPPPGRSSGSQGSGDSTGFWAECGAGAAQNVTDVAKQAGAWGAVWYASQFFPVVDVGVDGITVIATGSNALVGCLSSAGGAS